MRTRKRGGPAAAVICALGWLAAGPAVAGPEPPAPGAVSEAPEVQDARDAYRFGVSLIKQGQWNDALAAFEHSFRLKPDAVTAFNIGYCERALGRLTRARASFRRALAAPELPPDKAAEARGYVAEVESRLSRVVLTLSPAGASVAVDGRPLEDPHTAAAELVAGTREPGPPEVVSTTSFSVALDPGTHVFVIGAPGLPDAVVTRELAAGATATLTLSVGHDGGDPRTFAPAIATLAPLAEKPAAVRSARRIGAIIAFGAGGASALLGAVFGALALKDKGILDGKCPQPNQCEGSAQGTIDALNAFATVSTVGLGAAVAGAGAGTILLLTGDRSAPVPRAAMRLSLGPAYAGLHGSF